MSAPRNPRPARPARAVQRGNTLLTVLVLLLVMTLLALASLRIGSLEERMTANLFDRSLAFQATEAALREGEALALSLSSPPAAGDKCIKGVCGRPPYTLNPDNGFDALFKANARAAAPLADNALAVPKADDVRFLVVHQGVAEVTHGCSSILGANGWPRDPLCLADVYHVEARYQAEGRASVALHSRVLVPASASTSL
nr:PilX N-terminal domain-containing pilus assembly protein [Pseudoxanthomonas sp.]